MAHLTLLCPIVNDEHHFHHPTLSQNWAAHTGVRQRGKFENPISLEEFPFTLSPVWCGLDLHKVYQNESYLVLSISFFVAAHGLLTAGRCSMAGLSSVSFSWNTPAFVCEVEA